MSNARIGRMRHRITLKKRSDAPTATFSNTTTYTLVKEVWGELVSASGRQYYTVRNISESATHILTTRYYDEIDTMGENDHCVYCGRLFRILSTQIFDERNRFIIFQLEELGEESSFVS